MSRVGPLDIILFICNAHMNIIGINIILHNDNISYEKRLQMRYIFISIFMLVVMGIVPCRAELRHGFGSMINDSWDFSDSTSIGYPDYSTAVDIYMYVTLQNNPDTLNSPSIYMVSANFEAGALITVVDSAFIDLKSAPEDLNKYTYSQYAYYNVTYVVKTIEDNYVKFRFTDLYETAPYPTIEYYYQTDGSRKLYEPIGISESSWGRIKSICN